jgi:ABC-type antimicrobial peptide transport system permease subunit
LPKNAAIGPLRCSRWCATTLLGLFATGSLIIAGLGLYAVIAFNMGRRVRELGLRMALGASSTDVLLGVLKEGAVMTGTGLAVGFVLSLGVAFLARSTLVGVTPADPRTYVAVFAVLASVSLAASYLPARRAARVDPVVALRQE